MSTALIIGAAALGVFFVLRSAQGPSGPASPAAKPCGVPVTSNGVTVTIPCSVIKNVATAPVNVTRGVVGAIAGTNPSVSLFGQATGAVAGTPGGFKVSRVA